MFPQRDTLSLRGTLPRGDTLLQRDTLPRRYTLPERGVGHQTLLPGRTPPATPELCTNTDVVDPIKGDNITVMFRHHCEVQNPAADFGPQSGSS